MMPKLNGLEVIKIVRTSSNVPILIISAKGFDIDKSTGLDIGADDYISKPFSMIEFSSRINALIKRRNTYNEIQENPKENEMIFKDLILDLNHFCVIKNKNSISLTSKEFEILKLLLKNKNRVFTKSQIYELIWNDKYYGDENVINVHMRRLREKIETNPSKPEYIKNHMGNRI